MRPDRTSVTVSSLPEYVPTKKDVRRNALRLMRDARRAAARKEWLAQREAGNTTVDLRQALYRDALTHAAQILEQGKDRDRSKMVEIVMEHELECQRLSLELNGARPTGQPALSASGHENVLTRDEAVEILQARRRRQAVGA